MTDITMNNKELASMQKLVEFSKNIDNNYKFKIAAAIMYKGRLISVVHNELKSHPFQSRFSKNKDAIFFHAETRAIHKALSIIGPEKIKNATLFVARTTPKVNKRNQVYSHILADSKPCEGCTKCIEYYGIKKVFYTTTEKFTNILAS